MYLVRYGGATVWQTYQIRVDRDEAVFGELTFDFNDKFTGTVGARYFEYENELYGFNGFGRHCTGLYIDGEFVQLSEAEGGVIQYPWDLIKRKIRKLVKQDEW